jgi:hypothetical protein
MTVSAGPTKITQDCNGSLTDFDFNFAIYKEEDLAIIVRETATGIETILVLNTDYTIASDDFADGGTVSTIEEVAEEFIPYAWPAGYTITIMLDIALTQETDLLYGGIFSAEAIEQCSDKLTRIAQQLSERLKRSIKFQKSSDHESVEIEDLEAGKIIVVNETGDGLKMGTVAGEPGQAPISNDPYNKNTWNGQVNIAPSKNVIRDEWVNNRFTKGGTYATVMALSHGIFSAFPVSNIEYGNSWATVIDTAASKKAIYNKIESLGGGGDVIGPATHGPYHVPQWCGTPSNNILIDGFDISLQGKDLVNDMTAAAQRTTLELQSAALRTAEGTLTDGSNLPDGHAIKTYGDANWGGGGGSPGGADTHIQFNDGGSFGGDVDFKWIKATNQLDLVNTQIKSRDLGPGDFTLDSSPFVGAWFPTWSYKGCNVIKVQQAMVLPTNGANHCFVDALEVNHYDTDPTNYQISNTQHEMHCVNLDMNGICSSIQYKDMIGLSVRCLGRIGWDSRGCSAITCETKQYGIGIASNEFHVFNPAPSEGGHEQSKSMAGLQIVMHPHMGDEDASHIYRGLMIDTFGKRITYGIWMSSTPDGFGSGHMKRALSMDNATVTDCAITMPQSASSHVGTIIEYDANDYTLFDRGANEFQFVVAGNVIVGINANCLTMADHKIVNVANPTDAQDVATKAYGDANWGGGGGGNVTGPATHGIYHVPQWNGTPNSRTLIDGFDISNQGKDLVDDMTAAAQRTTLELQSAALRTAEDALTDGSNLPDGHAIKTYGDANWSGGSGPVFTIVAMGQSNMVGFSGSGGDKATDSRVTAWNGSAWVTANLSNTPFSSNNNNIAFHFAKQIAEKQNRNVRIILEAENGQPISGWVPASASHYVGMKNQISASGTTKVDVVLWHQGESDFNRSYAAYGADLQSLVTQLRGEAAISVTTPIVMGELLAGGVYSYQNHVYERITDYVADSFVNVAKAKFLPSCGSNVHFSGDSLVVLGRLRYYTAMQTMTGMAPGHKGSANVTNINECADKINNANLEIYDELVEVANGNVRARRYSDQTISDSTWSIVQFNIEDWDLGNNFSNYRFTSTAVGYYQIITQCMYGMFSSSSDVNLLSIFQNGTRTGLEDHRAVNSGQYLTLCTCGVVKLNVGNYVDVRVLQASGSSQKLVANGTGETKQWIMIKRLL